MADRITPDPERADYGWHGVRNVDRAGAMGQARNLHAVGDDVDMPDQPVQDGAQDQKLNPDAAPIPTGRPRTQAAVEEDLNTAGVIRDVPDYPASPAGTRAVTGAAGGVVGAVFLVALAYALVWTGPLPFPSFVAAERAWVGQHGVVDHVVGVLGFLAAGAAWGAVFGLLVRKPTLLKGAAFGFVPTLFLWVVMAPLTHQPLFGGFTVPGLLVPVLFNVLIWGTYVGRFCERRLRPPSVAATAPTTDII